MRVESRTTALQRGLYDQALKNPDAKFELGMPWDLVRTGARRLWRSNGKNTPGVDGQTARYFRGWRRLAYAMWTTLSNGQYQVAPLRRLQIPKASGGTRPIGIPTLLDRLVQHIFLLQMVPVLEANFLPVNWCPRPGMDRHAALQHLGSLLRRRGCFIAETDIKACFDTVYLDSVKTALGRYFEGDLFTWLCDVMMPLWQLTPGRGLAAGAPGSPMFMSAVLASVDRLLLDEANVHALRWADDLFIVTDTRAGAERCLELVRAELEPLGMKLSPSKTKVVSVEEGASFLGVHARRTQKGEVQLTVEPDRLRGSLNKVYINKDPEQYGPLMASVLQQWGPYIPGHHTQQIVAEFHMKTGQRIDPTVGRCPAVPRTPAWMSVLRDASEI